MAAPLLLKPTADDRRARDRALQRLLLDGYTVGLMVALTGLHRRHVVRRLRQMGSPDHLIDQAMRG